MGETLMTRWEMVFKEKIALFSLGDTGVLQEKEN